MDDHLREMLFGDSEDANLDSQTASGAIVAAQRTAVTLS